MEEQDSTKYQPCCWRCVWENLEVATDCECACETCPTKVREQEFKVAMDMKIAALRTAAAKHPEFRFGI